MASASSNVAQFAVTHILLAVIAGSLAGIGMLLAFIIGRRWIRSRYFRRRDALAKYFRQHWNELLTDRSANVPWPSNALASEVLESILLDRIEIARPEELPELIDFLRRAGVLDRRIAQARMAPERQKQTALIVLGRTRALEAIPALAEALDSKEPETRLAAARGLGRIARPAAALPVLEHLAAGTLEVPWPVLKQSLLACCAGEPEMLLRFLRNSSGAARELISRVLAEIADGASVDELLILVSDPSAEVRCSAARGLARTASDVAIPALADLSRDDQWFVRLRAVIALGNFVERGAVPILVRSLGDRNRLVRQRAAWALIRSRRLVPDVLGEIVDRGDNYGMQAVVAELERCGLYKSVMEDCRHSGSDGENIVSTLEHARTRLARVTAPALPEKEPVVA